ncbi:hypothetical protein GCM10007079_12000 [Nocardiopsis terrae]|uniref:Double-GTPase 2 domain-containing protein n=1 Tax=Nocardiopsis terrae TaxID=372655 RepID=A0ABR9HC36_9ACTN|nr:hypothetical protein [Nocardiopsis terrae]MBE1456590.1 hypothetical protein [Nocardiopsis terrae]GHC76054.1 hypothetical protein GCM10007079_12000 [Nocardiopsis terrae]
MPQLIAILVLLALGLLAVTIVIYVVGFLLWLLLALVVRIFAWVLVIWLGSSLLGLVGGVLRGVVLPPFVLAGREEEEPRIASPEAVVAGEVLGKAPRGQARHSGWDHAWPVYIPYQSKRDANAVLAAARRIGFDAFLSAFDRWFIAVLFLPVITGYTLGVWVSVLCWYLIMQVLGGTVHLFQKLGVLVYRWSGQVAQKRRKAELHCVKCYRVTPMPSYRCANPHCSTIHHDVRPGPLGVTRRRCGCGTRIPVTVSKAARHLTALCPFCLENAPDGSGTRRVLAVPVIGAVGAGKTQFLATGVVELGSRVESLSGSLAPISTGAEGFVRTAANAVSTGRRVAKTAWDDRPEGVPLLLSLRGREVEVHLMDAAGENFVSWERSQSLSYIDTADTLLFVLDPLALPAVRERLRLADEGDSVPLAQGDQEDAYASVADRLRAAGVRLDGKRLAVVLTKLDVLRRLPDTGGLDPEDSGSVREWLRANGVQGFVRRIDQDFRMVDYFAVDSLGAQDGADPSHPVRVFDWALRSTDPRLAVLSPRESVPAAEGKGA